MIEALGFDFDGTLVDYVDSDIKSLKHLHTVMEAKVSFDEFLEAAVDEIMQFHRLVDQRLIDPLLMHRYRLENTFQACGMQWDDSALEIYRSEFFRTCVPFDGVVEVLAQLRERFKLGIITNAYDGEEQRKRIAVSGLHDYFDEILISGDVGVYKPDPKIFHMLLNRIGVVPEKALYVGDSIKYDVAGANFAGMKSVLFSKNSKRLSSEANFHVHGVEGLKSLASELCELA